METSERKTIAADSSDCSHKPEEDNTQQSRREVSLVSQSVDASNGSNQMPSGEASKRGTPEKTEVRKLYQALLEGNLQSVKKLIGWDLTTNTRILVSGEIALHIAVLAGHVNIVEELVNLMTPESLTTITYEGETTLTLAAARGNTDIAKLLVKKNDALLGMANVFDCIPVVMAAQFGHKKMVHFLFHESREKLSKTPRPLTREERLLQSNEQVAKLFTACITTQLYDIALEMLKWNPIQSIAVLKDSAGEALNLLARDPTLRSESHLPFWRNWIYSFPFIKHILERKSKDGHARELLENICEAILTWPTPHVGRIVSKPLLTAVSCGNILFIVEVARTNPDILWAVCDEDGQTLFSCAVLERQEEIVRFLHSIGAMQRPLAIMSDNDGNNILHQAAMLSPGIGHGYNSNAALKMKRELQWFEEVEKISPMYKEVVNNDGVTPRALFTLKHKQLLEAGEKWMKEAATSCTVVAALIVTIMFAAAFTVPGGYHGDTGIPIYLHSRYFIIFMASDALSLFFSSISVLMFLVIHTSSYREEDFLNILPAKLAIGLSGLFLSIATMMVTFGSAIAIMLHDRFVWIPVPIIMAASFLAIFFVLWQYPLYVQIVKLTFRPSIINHSKE